MVLRKQRMVGNGTKRRLKVGMLMKILVNGAGGQLGKDVISILSPDNELIGFDKRSWDVTDEQRSKELIEYINPDVVIHCAAYTQVDRSEDEPNLAYRVNVMATRQLAKLCSEKGIRLVYISTDYVFNGLNSEGYSESDYPHPINFYGRTKRLGEKWVQRCCPNHLILRTSWLYGKHGNNFVYSILNKVNNQEPISVVIDQIGSPTYTKDLASYIQYLLQTKATGIFHLSNTGSCSWYSFAKAILDYYGIKADVNAITSDQLKRRATRPNYSILYSLRLKEVGLVNTPYWKDSLYNFLGTL